MAAAAIAIAAYVAMNTAMWTDIVNHLDERRAVKSALYLGWLACGFFTFSALVVAAPTRVLWPVLALVLASLTTNYAFLSIVRDPLTVDVIQWLPYESAQLGNASQEYAREIALAGARAAILIGLFLLVRVVARRSPAVRGLARRRVARHGAPAAFGAFFAAGLALQPPTSVAETNLYVFGLPALLEREPAPQPLAARPARRSAIDKVVVVIDESITWEAYRKLLAPRLSGLPVIDFGEAASTTNCSAPSNALLRWGVDIRRVHDASYDPRANPTIWAYARAAGYATVLIDGQSQGQKQNYLTPGELALIDTFVPAKRATDTDLRIVERLNAELRRPGRTFMVIVKHGAHFPYSMNYPAGIVPDDAPRTLQYVAAVTHTSGRFFDALARDLPFERILVIYTSDHGQDLSNRSTHCNPSPSADEYSVPLVAITAAPALKTALRGSKLVDRASHLNIFPTVVEALGYDPAIEKTYGPTLAGPPTPYLTYVNRGWHARQSRGDRHTVRATDFVASASFPYRGQGEQRHMALDGVGASGFAMQ